MVTVDYAHRFSYPYPEDGGFQFPGLLMELRNPVTGASVEVVAHIDSGAEATLFDGNLAAAIGFDLTTGTPRPFSFVSGGGLQSYQHTVSLRHDSLGDFALAVAFSANDLRRNVLGRDFLKLVQIGFRENELEFYITREV